MEDNERGEREAIMRSLRDDIAELTDDPGLAEGIGEHDRLESAGVDSFLMIHLILRVEERYGRRLADGELKPEAIGTLGGLADGILGRRWGDTA